MLLHTLAQGKMCMILWAVNFWSLPSQSHTFPNFLLKLSMIAPKNLGRQIFNPFFNPFMPWDSKLRRHRCWETKQLCRGHKSRYWNDFNSVTVSTATCFNLVSDGATYFLPFLIQSDRNLLGLFPTDFITPHFCFVLLFCYHRFIMAFFLQFRPKEPRILENLMCGLLGLFIPAKVTSFIGQSFLQQSNQESCRCCNCRPCNANSSTPCHLQP